MVPPSQHLTEKALKAPVDTNPYQVMGWIMLSDNLL